VHALAPQVLDSQIKILVIDNHSPEIYESLFMQDPILARLIKNGVLEIRRNVANLGMSANFLRSFEVVDTDWLWMLSDDDYVAPTAVENIKKEIRNAGEKYGFIKFSSPRSRPSLSRIILNNLEEFIDYNSKSVHDFNGFIFISNGVYRIQDFKKFLVVGYQHAHTYIPHFMMLVAFMNGGGMLMISQQEIVGYVQPTVGYSYGLTAGLGVGAPKSLLVKLSPKYTKRFYGLFFPHNDFKVIIDLYYHCKSNATLDVFSYHVKNYIHLVSIIRSRLRVMQLYIVSWIAYSPILFEFLLNYFSKKSIFFNNQLKEIKARYEASEE
jgi:hypothetical protein